MQDAIRLFIAIQISEDVRDKLSKFVDALKKFNDKITWTAPENIHLTMKFFGDVPIKDVETVKGIMSDAVKKYSPFEISVKGAGVFPNEKNPRVIWAGVEKGKDVVGKIYTDLGEGLAAAGFSKEERKFTPHLTVGRVKYIKDLNGFSQLISEHKEDLFGNVNVEDIELVKSKLTPKGSIYETIHKARLINNQ